MNTLYPVKSLRSLMYEHELLEDDVLNLLVKKLDPLADQWGNGQIGEYTILVPSSEYSEELCFLFNETSFGYNEIAFDSYSDTIFSFYDKSGEVLSETDMGFFEALDYLSNHGNEFSDLILQLCREIQEV